jgi:hypothetical protein
MSCDLENKQTFLVRLTCFNNGRIGFDESIRICVRINSWIIHVNTRNECHNCSQKLQGFLTTCNIRYVSLDVARRVLYEHEEDRYLLV